MKQALTEAHKIFIPAIKFYVNTRGGVVWYARVIRISSHVQHSQRVRRVGVGLPAGQGEFREHSKHAYSPSTDTGLLTTRYNIRH